MKLGDYKKAMRPKKFLNSSFVVYDGSIDDEIVERTGFYEGALVTEDGPNKGKYKVKFSYNQDYGNPKFKGVQYGTKEEIEKLIADRKIAADASYKKGVDKAAQIAKDKAEIDIKKTIDSFIEKGDYENFKTKPYESQLKRKLPSGNIRQSGGGRVNPKTFKYIRDMLDVGNYENLSRITGRSKEELIQFSNKIPEKGIIDVEQRAKSAAESFPEERKLTEEQKQEADKKVQAKRKGRLEKTTGKAKFIKGSDDFQFHHIKQIGGEAPLTAADVKVIDKVMNGELAPYNRKLNDIADAISQKITESFEAMRNKNEGKALDLLNEVDALNKQAEGIVKSAHDKLPAKFKPLIGYNKVYARTDEYGFPLDDKVRIEPIGGGLQKGERAKPLTEYTRKDAQELQKEIDKQVEKLEKINQLKKDNPILKSGDEIEQPEKSKIRGMFESFNDRAKALGNTYRSVRPSIDTLTKIIPGKADNALAAAIDFPMMYMSGAPLTQAAASAGSMFINNPNIGKAVNIGLEQAALSDEEQFLKNAAKRREGIESILQNIPTRLRENIEQNKGIEDETEIFVP